MGTLSIVGFISTLIQAVVYIATTPTECKGTPLGQPFQRYAQLEWSGNDAPVLPINRVIRKVWGGTNREFGERGRNAISVRYHNVGSVPEPAWLVEKGFGWLKQTGPLRPVKLRGLEKVDWLLSSVARRTT